MRKALALALALVLAPLFALGCKAKEPQVVANHAVEHTADRVPDASPEPVGTLDKGEVCMKGRRDQDPAVELRAQTPCKPGLVCGYPCGMAGCDWECMTPEDADLLRP